mgnify:CR=1 FL=1
MTHFDHLEQYIPNLRTLSILDIGSGLGGFFIDATGKGATVTGIEISDEYIAKTQELLKRKGSDAEVVKGVGENIPFNSASFDFVNLCEVIEHVEDPEEVLTEVLRVLNSNGMAYMSLPNHFVIKKN